MSATDATARRVPAAEQFRFPLRWTRDLRRRARQDAGRHERSVNEHIVFILEQHLPPAQDT